MAWNKPGDENNDDRKDRKPVWSNNDQNSGPPELDAALGKLGKQVKSVFGGGGSGGGQDDSGLGASMIFFLVIAFILWVLSGIFIVGPGEEAVILRFGKYSETLQPGPHWVPRLVYSYKILNVEKVSTYTYESQMLNKDENIVSVALAVHYRVSNPQKYLFNVKNPFESLRQATASALRQVVGHMSLDEILTKGRTTLRDDVEKQIRKIMEMYGTGIEITDVALQSTKAPEEVKHAFDDAITAQEDEQRFIHEARAYARGKLPEAEGKAQRILFNARAYRQERIAAAEGESQRFLSVLKEYKLAPKVTRKRLYLDTIRSVLSHTNKVLVDAKGNNMMYLPLDQIARSKSLEKALSEKAQHDAQEAQRRAYEKALEMSRNSYASQMSQTEAVRKGRASYQGRGQY